MAANKFERNISRTLDDFKLRPSDEVWEKVKERIRERKRRRFIFFLFSIAGVFVFSCLAYFLSTMQDWHSDHQHIPLKPTSATAGGQTQNNRQEPPLEKKIKIENIPGNARLHLDLNRFNKHVATRRDEETYFAKSKTSETGKSVAQNITIVIRDNQKSPETRVHLPSDASGSTSADLLSQQPAGILPGKIVHAAPWTNINVDQRILMRATVTTGIVQVKDQNLNRERIEWGLMLSAGASALGGNRFSFSNSSGVSYASNVPATAGGGSQSQHSIENKAGFAFKTGLVLRKNFSSRISLLTGIGYSYLSDEIRIGAQQSGNLQLTTSNVSRYYAGSPQKEFTEHFHFAELPAVFSWKAVTGKNQFLSLDGGLSVSYLISTNGLVYDTTAGGVYYHNNDAFTKTHFNILSGVSYHMNSAKGFELIVGPQIAFDLTRAIQNNSDQRSYFLYTGLSSYFLFGKTKK